MYFLPSAVVLPRFRIFGEHVIGVENIQHQSMLAVQEPEPEDVFKDERKERPQQDIDPSCLEGRDPLLRHLGHCKGRIPVDG